jgi:hypothetical protein
MLVTPHFFFTSTPIEFRTFPYVMLGTCWEQAEQIDVVQVVAARPTDYESVRIQISCQR